MNDFRKKILLDLFVTPITVLPMTIGISLLMLSTILGSGWGFIGFCCCLLGIGGLVTNFLFNLRNICDRAIMQLMEKKTKDRNTALDELDVKLSSDRDPRDQTALRNLRGIYDCLMEDLRNGKIDAAVPSSMFDQIESIFDGCVVQLERQHEIWQTSRKVTGHLKNGLLKQKDSILDEVELSVKSLAEVVDEVRALGLKSHTGELSKLQQRLNSQLVAAKATDQLSTELDKQQDLSRFSEYDKQN